MRRKLEDFYFTLDHRSLGLFRIVLGGLLIWDWSTRWHDLEAFYTSFGILPARSPLLVEQFHFSLLDSLGSVAAVRVFFASGLLVYVGLLLGWRTRWFQVLALVFFASVLARNPMIVQGGDGMTIAALVWTAFLPMGARFSVDAVRRGLRRGVEPRRHPESAPAEPACCHASLAALAMVLQIGLIYFFTAFTKSGHTWKDGTAIWYSLHLDQMVKPLGTWLAQRPLGLLRFMTWGTLAAEWVALPMILLPFPQPLLRRDVLLGLAIIHLGSAWTIDLGTFPFVMIGSYALLLLPQDWTWIRRVALRPARSVTVYYDDSCGFCHRCCQVLALADRAGRIRFIGNSDPSLFRHPVSEDELDTTVVAFDDMTGRKTTRAAAAATILSALPLPFHVLRAVALPGVRAISDRVYDFVARNRHEISRRLGYAACGLETLPKGGTPSAALPHAAARETRQRNRLRFGRALETAVVVAILVPVLVDGYNSKMTPRLGRKKLDEPRWMHAVIDPLQFGQNGHLFAPHPFMDDGWWVLDGVTESGQHLDPMTGMPPSWEKPQRLEARYDVFWQEIMFCMSNPAYHGFRKNFARYLVRRDQREHPPGQRLLGFDFYYVEEMTLPPGTPEPFPTQRVRMWSYDCTRDRLAPEKVLGQ